MSVRAHTDVDVGSAGFIGPGRAPPDVALSVARSRGVDHSDHRSRTVTREMLTASDVTVVFDRFNVRDLRRSPGARLGRVFWLSDFDTSWTGKRAIIDPWGKGPEEFDETFARIERCVLEMLSVLETTDGGS
jgi:protein-tyrosine phosphatase